ncbi:hypothetical protein CICLE_v10007131mg [Citrus x clementina]|uniref:PGG domain-containing protein n=1 Tax=Citrus clementina TaxID=85681 RepID=V4RZN2_CITCL|nr:hypothetical protein CICLE_v10007131mg [Citrus x clementina]
MSSFSGSDNQNAETRRERLRSVREKNIQFMDNLYEAAVEGHVGKFEEHKAVLHQILTPDENTIPHIHITALPNKTMKPNNKANSLWRMISTFKKQSSSDDREVIRGENFVRVILEMCPILLLKANAKGETLLHIAARHGHYDIVQVLIAECKKPHQNNPEEGVAAARLMLGTTNEAKDTALHEAVRYNQVDVVKMLTKEDPNLSYDANEAGETPLYLAAERGYKDVMEDILSTCESPVDHGPMGRTALHAAAFREYTLQTYYYFFRKDRAGKGRAYTMQELIRSCPSSCELVDDRGWNVFHFAAHSGSRRTVEFLLENPSLGNLMNEKNYDGNTPLLEHAVSGSFIKSFVCHPKVDRLAFNHQNNSAEDIIRSKKVLIWENEESFLGCLARLNPIRCQRHIVNGNGERKEQGSNTSTEDKKSNDRKEKSSSRYEELEQSVNESKESHLVVAALIATVTFTAGITVPGGYINGIDPDQGAAVLAKRSAFQAFVIFNSLALILSASAVFFHLYLSLLRDKIMEYILWKVSRGMIQLAMFAMVFAFLTGTYSVLHNAKLLAVIASIITGSFFIFVYDFSAPFPLIKDWGRLYVRTQKKLMEEVQRIYFDDKPMFAAVFEQKLKQQDLIML